MKPGQQKRLVVPPISPAAPGTLYQQIVEGIKREISEGRLKSGEALPSFRVLAEDLLVSVITVKRAYEELEHEGIIYRKQGLGTFISDDGAARSREVKRAQAETLLRQALKEGVEAGLEDAALLALAKRLLLETRNGGEER